MWDILPGSHIQGNTTSVLSSERLYGWTWMSNTLKEGQLKKKIAYLLDFLFRQEIEDKKILTLKIPRNKRAYIDDSRPIDRINCSLVIPVNR